ncbi:MAG TPA: isoprenylcysteine carboxylmethyltransferase family protein [Burkholderiaceae bacterium]|nr:isoprenylcysteine carboxylmethyltransferase family protein [Burkholderiaceae bacterium]
MSAADSPGVVAPPPLLYLIALGAVLGLRWQWPLPIAAPSAVLWPAIVLCGSSLALGISGRRTLLAAGTAIDPARPTTVLVTQGPYRHSRNPVYLALTALFVGITLAADTWWGVAALLPLAAVMHYGVVLREERYLERKFGDAYRDYRIRVRRYV